MATIGPADKKNPVSRALNESGVYVKALKNAKDQFGYKLGLSKLAPLSIRTTW